MKKSLRYAGYVKKMDSMEILKPENRIPAIEIEVQKRHIQEYADSNNLTPTKIYADEDKDNNTAYFQLYEDAVHRKFDVLIVETMYCFGRNAFAAGNFISKVLLLTGFQVVFGDCKKDTLEYIKECLAVSRITYSRLEHKVRFQYKTHDYAPRKKANEELHELSYYENRQKEIFSEMLKSTEKFDELETELRECRRIIKVLRSRHGKKK